MSSISVGELKTFLDAYPDDYEVIMDWKWKTDNGQENAIAYINGIQSDDFFKEVRLLN